MASHEYPEQDLQGGDDLPTYDDLAETHGANSRFGRWRSWIEKRAAERYTDITQEERERRRQRGWDLNEHAEADLGAQPPVPQVRVEEPSVSAAGGSTSTPSRLSVQTLLKSLPEPPPLDEPEDNLSLESRLLISESLEPTHLCVKHFGSRFLAHTTSQIHTLLPILGDRLLLIGHDEGLSVMNMFPQDWGDDGLITQGPSEAQVHTIWRGEGVFQMTILEVESVGDGIPQGVLLALVGSEAEGTRDEPLRVLRMYNLASLISLAKWTIANKGAHPLQLGRTAEWQSQDSGSKRRKRASGHLAKGIKNFMTEAATQLQPELSTFPIRGRSPSNESRPSMGRTDTESSWDIVEDLPLRWATDHVPLATSGSRLSNLSVVAFALWKDGRQGRGSALLAVATKSSILLYESKGERAFRFVKDFYTPVTPRSLAFVHQAVQDTMSRSPSEASTIKHTRQSSNHIASQRHVSMNPRPVQYGQQLSLFIVFEKKAGIIRLADSAVAEVEMYNDSVGETSSLPDTSSVPSLTSPTRHSRRGRGSGDGFAMLRDHKGPWIVPAAAEVPFMSDGEFKQAIYCLTRGKKTHIVPNPFPADIAHTPPLKVLKWRTSPTSVACRVLNPDDRGRQPHLQVIASSEDGVEVLELPTATLLDRKEKGRAEEPLRSQTNFGGYTGLLCPGGHWDRPYDAPLAPLSRSYSTSSAMSYSSMDTDELIARLEMEQGLYGWQQRGLEDWRIFWAGGTGHDEVIG